MTRGSLSAASLGYTLRQTVRALESVPLVQRLLPPPGSTIMAAHVDPTIWRSVTVLCADTALADGSPAMAPLEAHSGLEVRRRPAPGGRGTELSVRARGGGERAGTPAGSISAAQVRSALRQVKQLAEVGEVLRHEPQPEGDRTSTPTGRLLDRVIESAGRQGVL